VKPASYKPAILSIAFALAFSYVIAINLGAFTGPHRFAVLPPETATAITVWTSSASAVLIMLILLPATRGPTNGAPRRRAGILRRYPRSLRAVFVAVAMPGAAVCAASYIVSNYVSEYALDGPRSELSRASERNAPGSGILIYANPESEFRALIRKSELSVIQRNLAKRGITIHAIEPPHPNPERKQAGQQP
jgi:hypothetical protein